MDLHGDVDPIDWEDHVEINEPPLELDIIGWNEDDTFEHTFTIYVVIIPATALPAQSISDVISRLFRMVLPIRLPGGGL